MRSYEAVLGLLGPSERAFEGCPGPQRCVEELVWDAPPLNEILDLREGEGEGDTHASHTLVCPRQAGAGGFACVGPLGPHVLSQPSVLVSRFE